MDCKKALLLLPAYYDDQLCQDEKRELESHLEVCTGCSKTFSTFNDLPDLLKDISPNHLPSTLRYEITAKVMVSLDLYKNIRLESTNIPKKILLHYIMVIALLVAAGIIIIASLTISVLKTEPWRSRISRIEELFTSKEVAKTSSPFNEAPNTNSAWPHPRLLTPRSIDYLPKPEVLLSDRHCDKNAIEKNAIKPVVVNFSQEYRIIEANIYQERIASEMVSFSGKFDQEEQAFRNSISVALSVIKKPALPSYAEEVIIDDKKAWIIVVNWEDGEQANLLSRIAVIAVDPSSGRIVNSWPGNLLGMDEGTQHINPHKTLSCRTCHPNFDESTQDISSSDWKKPARLACTRCHDHKKQYEVYAKSIHGQLALSGKPGKQNRLAPACADCHSEHSTLGIKKDSQNQNSLRLQAQEICGKCHQDYWDAYDDYYHGKAYKAHAPDAPVCWDCHGYHDIQPSSNPGSSVATQNLIMTCKKCHKDTDSNFVQYGKLVHGRKKQWDENIILRFLRRALSLSSKTADSKQSSPGGKK